MGLAVVGMGTAVPDTVFDQVEGLFLAKSLCCQTEEQVTWLPTMYEGTGITKRHMVLPRPVVDDVLAGTRKSGSVFLPTGLPNDDGPTTAQRMQVYMKEAAELAIHASRDALEEWGEPASRLTHLVTVSCTGFYAPGVDAALIRELKLRPTIERTHVGFMGCHGALNGLRVARSFARSEPQARVLLCAVELCSVHYHYGWDPGKVIANAIFADGAAAMIGVPSASAEQDEWRVAGSGSCLFPGSEKAMTWTVGNHGFVMSLSKKVPDLIKTNLRPWLEDWLGQQGVALNDVRSWAIHPGGPRILTAVEEALGLTSEQTQDAQAVFREHGNMSSPTVLFIIRRMRAGNAPRPCVAIGFGPGLIAEAALLR